MVLLPVPRDQYARSKLVVESDCQLGIEGGKLPLPNAGIANEIVYIFSRHLTDLQSFLPCLNA